MGSLKGFPLRTSLPRYHLPKQDHTKTLAELLHPEGCRSSALGTISAWQNVIIIPLALNTVSDEARRFRFEFALL